MADISTQYLKGRSEDGILELRLTLSQIQEEKVAQALCDEFTSLAEQHKNGHVIVDFGSIKYISSVAFRPLLLLRRKVQEFHGRLILCNFTPNVGDIFYTTRMVDPSGGTSSLFETAKDVAGARQMLLGKSEA